MGIKYLYTKSIFIYILLAIMALTLLVLIFRKADRIKQYKKKRAL